MELMRGISGIRGIVGKNLTEPVVIRHIRAFSEIQGVGDILLARDSRTHGASLIIAAAKTLSGCGRNVINYDIIPTPTAQFLIEQNKMAGGIVITASHNPTEWNGMKFIDTDGCFLDGEKNKNLFDIADSNPAEHQTTGSIQIIENGYLPHITHTRGLSIIDTETIEKRNFTIVVDAVNGAASRALPTMVEALGCQP